MNDRDARLDDLERRIAALEQAAHARCTNEATHAQLNAARSSKLKAENDWREGLISRDEFNRRRDQFATEISRLRAAALASGDSAQVPSLDVDRVSGA